MQIRSKLGIVLSAGAAALVVGSLAWAAIPDPAGVIHGCYDKDTGRLRVTDTQTGQPKACAAKEAALNWSQQGPAGPAGPAGQQGPPGPAGTNPGADAFVNRFGTATGNAVLAAGAPCTLGQVLLTASPSRTAGGMPANGQLLPIAQNAALFALLGTTYGGDGKTTFALPDLRAIAPSSMSYSVCTNGTWPAT